MLNMEVVLREHFHENCRRRTLDPVRGHFRLTGFAHHPDTLNYLAEHMNDYRGFFCQSGLDQGTSMMYATTWGEHVIPTPRLGRVAKRLINEEAWLTGKSEYFTFEHERIRGIVIDLVESNFQDQDWQDRLDGDEWEDQLRRRATRPAAYYPRCLAETENHSHLERALLHGYVKCDELTSNFASRVKSYHAEQMNKLLAYQVIRRTILRVNRRCTLYRQERSLPEDLQTVVCAYLGETPSARWHDASYDDMWIARVSPSTFPRGLLSRPFLGLHENHNNQGIEYTEIGHDFWVMPQW